MNVITRNFFRLLSVGAFNETSDIEPMSLFKWNKLSRMIQAQDVVAFAVKGLEHFQRQIPSKSDLAYLKITPEDVTPNVTCELANQLFNYRLKNIRSEERRSVEVSIESLKLLDIIVANENCILNRGISLTLVLHLGVYLRAHGNKIDFVKIDKWLAQIHLTGIAELIGNILISVFHFSQSEIPFVHHLIPSAYDLTMKSVSRTTPLLSPEWTVRQNKAGMVRYSSSGVWKSMSRNRSFLFYAPIETMSNFISNIAHGLSQIDE